jgi:hypothetical protein
VLDQLAGVHLRHQDGVSTDDGDRTAGAVAALSAADGFHQAAVLLDQRTISSAPFVQSGKIVWHPQPAAEVERWISVVFLQGDEADRPLRILGELGTSTRWTTSPSGTTATRPPTRRWRTGTSTTNPAKEPTIE